jgi:RNA polymerase sigma factor (TIGR02999 family)
MDAASEQPLDELFGQLYEKIKRLAARVRWNGTNPTLNPTALAHEAYLKLREHPPDLSSKNYEDVIRVFAHAMRQILADAARRKGAVKRVAVAQPEDAKLPVEDAMTLNMAMEELEKENPRQARIVECRYLLGMTVEETAAATGQSISTVEREWREAREWLGRKIQPPGNHEKE